MAKLSEEVLWRLPPIGVDFILSLWGKKQEKMRRGGHHTKHFERYKNNWFKPLDELLLDQESQLRLLLLEAFHHTALYRKLMDDIGINESDIVQQPLVVLQKMPMLEKETRRTEVNSLLNNNRESSLVDYTSGTSGSPTTTYYDLDSLQRSYALWDRFHWSIGLSETESMKKIRFSGKLFIPPSRKKPPFWAFSKPNNQLVMSSYHLSDSTIDYYIEKINSFKPDLIDGYPSAIDIVASRILKNNTMLQFKPKAICTTAETLTESVRERISKAFACDVYNQYSSSEGGGFITECKMHNLHVNLDSAYFEFVGLNGLAPVAGELAEIVVTSFRNYKTPLIRYRQGDIVRVGSLNEKCNCGSKMPMVREVIGREEDVLFVPDKGFVGRLDPVFKGLSDIVASQIVQESKNYIIVNLVKGEGYSESIEKTLISNIRDRVGHAVEIKIKFMEKIPLGANGKFKAVVRKFELP